MTLHSDLWSLTRMAEALTFEDVPISLVLYPEYRLQENRLVKEHEGRMVPWGMSGTWMGEGEHLMLPQAQLLSRPPQPGLLVECAPAFDFVYDAVDVTARLENHSRVKRIRKRNLYHFQEVIGSDLPLLEMQTVFRQAMVRLTAPHPEFEALFLQLLEELDCHFLTQNLRVVLVKRGTGLVGFQLLWIAGAQQFQVHRYIVPEHLDATRLLDLHLAEMASHDRLAINVGDAQGLPGVQQYKFSLKPAELRSYFNVVRSGGPHA